jgi:phospholipase C
VIFMQENRSFDHYFGTLKGVRGFADPRAITLPGGEPVWYQPKSSDIVTPFHLDTRDLALAARDRG